MKIRLAIIDQSLGKQADGTTTYSETLALTVSKNSNVSHVELVGKNIKDYDGRYTAVRKNSVYYALSKLFRCDVDIMHWNYIPYSPFTILFVLLCRLRGIRQIVTIHGDLPWTEPQYAPLIRRIFEPVLYPFYARIFSSLIVPSKNTAKNISRALLVDIKKIHIVYNPIHDDFLRQTENRLSIDNTGSHGYFLIVANNDKKKNVETVISAYKKYIENGGKYLLKIAGKGYIDCNIQGIESLGSVNRHQLINLYANAVAILHPSVHETFGYPVIEGLALGKPVFACDKYAINEVACGEAYLTDECKSIDKWISILKKIDSIDIQSDNENNALTRISVAKQYSSCKFRDKMLEIYSE